MSRFANTSNVPLSLAVFLATDHYDHNSDPFTISATTLLKPVRQIILGSRVPPQEAQTDLVERLSNCIGSAIHDNIERAWKTNYKQAMLALGYPQQVIDRVVINPNPAELVAAEIDKKGLIPIYLEQRLSRKIGKWTVTGKFDMIAEGRIEDFKSASVWSYKNQVNADKQIQQGSIYRWLDNGRRVHEAQMRIVHIFVDWRRSDAARDPKYPPQRFASQLLQLMSLSETEQFIARKLALIEQYWYAPEDQIPECDDEALWRSEPVYKYYSDPAKADTPGARSTKNFDDRTQAMLHLSQAGKGVIKDVPGKVKACSYCGAFNVCTQKDRLIASGDLDIQTVS